MDSDRWNMMFSKGLFWFSVLTGLYMASVEFFGFGAFRDVMWVAVLLLAVIGKNRADKIRLRQNIQEIRGAGR